MTCMVLVPRNILVKFKYSVNFMTCMFWEPRNIYLWNLSIMSNLWHECCLCQEIYMWNMTTLSMRLWHVYCLCQKYTCKISKFCEIFDMYVIGTKNYTCEILVFSPNYDIYVFLPRNIPVKFEYSVKLMICTLVFRSKCLLWHQHHDDIKSKVDPGDWGDSLLRRKYARRSPYGWHIEL